MLSEGEQTSLDFVALYSPLSQPLHFLFYVLTVICTISILDRWVLIVLMQLCSKITQLRLL